MILSISCVLSSGKGWIETSLVDISMSLITPEVPVAAMYVSYLCLCFPGFVLILRYPIASTYSSKSISAYLTMEA